MHSVSRSSTSTIAPDQWTTNVIVPLPKKGTSDSWQTTKGLHVNCCKGIQQGIVDEDQRPYGPYWRNQAGFRQSRSCSQPIHTLRRIIQHFITFWHRSWSNTGTTPCEFVNTLFMFTQSSLKYQLHLPFTYYTRCPKKVYTHQMRFISQYINTYWTNLIMI